MSSRKTFLYGLGTGLIAGAILLKLAGIGEAGAKAPEFSPDRLTHQELRAAAEANGYVLHDAKLDWFTQEQLEQRIAEAEDIVRKELEEVPSDVEEEVVEEEAKITYAFTISPGTELKTIARLLYDLGMIDDDNGFLVEMERRGLDSKVQAGHYRFDQLPDLDQLIEALVTK